MICVTVTVHAMKTMTSYIIVHGVFILTATNINSNQ